MFSSLDSFVSCRFASSLIQLDYVLLSLSTFSFVEITFSFFSEIAYIFNNEWKTNNVFFRILSSIASVWNWQLQFSFSKKIEQIWNRCYVPNVSLPMDDSNNHVDALNSLRCTIQAYVTRCLYVLFLLLFWYQTKTYTKNKYEYLDELLYAASRSNLIYFCFILCLSNANDKRKK